MKRRMINRKDRYKVYEELLDDQKIYQEIVDASNKVMKIVKAELPWVSFLEAFNLLLYGDSFFEECLDESFSDDLNLLPVEKVYRIETISGKLLEFQQSDTGPDYKAIAGSESSKVIRFTPDQIIHVKCADTVDQGFYPYGLPMTEKFIQPEIDIDFVAEASKNLISALTTWRTNKLWRE